jgi:hypothetical protein
MRGKFVGIPQTLSPHMCRRLDAPQGAAITASLFENLADKQLPAT